MAEIVQDETLEVISLLQGYAQKEPRVYDAIMIIATQLSQLTQVVAPIQKAIAISEEPARDLLSPEGATYSILNSIVRLAWTRPPNGGSYTFEIRQGNVWESAEFITRTTGTSVDLLPLPGSIPNYLIKSIDAAGNYSLASSAVGLVFPTPEAVSITGQVIDNNVLLRWTDAVSQFDIDYYEILKNSQLIGTIRANFTGFFEMVAGSYNYEIVPVDVVGNKGPASRINLSVNQPPDYVLTSTTVSDFRGTKVAAKVFFDTSLVGA